MRMLFVSPRQCLPPTSGAKIRDYHFAQALGKWSDLTYVYFQEPGSEALTTSDLSFTKNVIAVPRPQGYSALNLIRGLAGSLPLTVLNYHSLAMRRALEQLVTRNFFDVIHLDATQLAGYQSTLQSLSPRSAVVYNWHNIESELLRRYAANPGSPIRRFYAHLTADRMESLEIGLLRSPAAHLVCSERERVALTQKVPAAKLAVVENGVDTHAYEGRAADPRDRNRILFVGLMAYHANAEAAVWFAREAWPQIHSEFPHLTLTIAGANPTEDVRGLASQPAVEVTGTVPDVRPYYDEAFVVVAPLSTGSGTRLKILEAMAAGVPVISTPLGAEGLDISPDENILIARAAADWLPALRSLRDKDRWERTALAGRRLVESRYDWTRIGNRLVSVYSAWLPVPASS